MDGTMGDVLLWAAEHVPPGWLTCEGQMLAPGRHPALFTLLGTQFGGDGVVAFGLPDCRGRDNPGYHTGQSARQPLRYIICIQGGHPYAPQGQSYGPAGAVKLVVLETPPKGWLFCEGQTLRVRDYPDLFRVIKTRFGGDRARGIFRVPKIAWEVEKAYPANQLAPTPGLRYVISYRDTGSPRA